MKTVGIKLADGSFYPVMEEGTPQSKTLELTTANNDQTCIMVDLYRSENGSMEDAEYVDTLKIDNLVKHPNGEPSFSFSLDLDENNELTAKIVDPETGGSSDSAIPLISRTTEERIQADNYSISSSGPISFTGLYDKETVMGKAASYDDYGEKKTRLPVIICTVCAAICVIATLIILFLIPAFSGKKPSKDKNVAVETTVVPEAKENEVVVVEQGEKVLPVQPSKTKNGDVKYVLRWGDTLWDIADAYYKNPWNYKKIARYNNIINPDHIISGTEIIIPAN